MARPAVPASSKRPSQEGQRGYAAGKRVKGRKRHIAVDAMGLLLAVAAPSAGIQDRVDVRVLLVRLFLHFECLKTIFADSDCTCKLRQTGADRKTSCYGWMSSTVYSARLSPGHFLCRACVFPAGPQADMQAAHSYS